MNQNISDDSSQSHL